MGEQVLACHLHFDVVGGPNLRGVPEEDEKGIDHGGLSSFSLDLLRYGRPHRQSCLRGLASMCFFNGRGE